MIQGYTKIRWQVTISILFSWLCHSVSAQIHYSIAEEMRKDSVIGNIADDLGLDIKQLSSSKLRIVSRASEKYLYANVDNGNLYIKDRIDREALCGAEASCHLTFDAVVENPFNIFKIKIEIQDINDNSPRFFHEMFSIEIIEAALPGTRLALQSAEDPDIGLNSIQSYKLSDNQYFILSERVRLDGSKFPELVLERSLDREKENVHILTLTAMDAGNPVRSGTALISVIVIDANDNFPIFGNEIYKVSIQEDIPINTTIVTVNATDKDEGINAQITYSFSKTSDNIHHTGMFIVNPITGDIKTNGNLDFEVTRNYELSVQAKDGIFVSHCKVLIEDLDINDNVPEIVINLLLSPIPEDSKPGTMIALIEVHDLDSGDNGEVDCEIIEIVPFDLKLSSDNYYKLALSMSLDREKQAYYNITIVATDHGSPPLSNRRTIELEVADVNDNPPMFIKSEYIAYIPENNLPGASIYSIRATDPDLGDNAKIIYTISTKDTEKLSTSSYFSINIETGVLYAQRSFDYEQDKGFQIQVNAKDHGSPSLESNVTLIIHIVDQNDNIPKILYPSAENGGSDGYEMVPLMSEPRSLVTKVVAVDADSGHNSWLSYHFIHVSEPSYFIIGEHTGEIRTSRTFQEKDTLKHKVVVMVKDNGDHSLSSTVTLNLFVANNIQQAVPKLNNHIENEDLQSNLHLYLVTAVVLISLLFIVTVMIGIISKCKGSKHLSTTFGAVGTNIYPQVDSRMLSMYSDGSLPFPYSYNVCVALDSAENDFSYIKKQQNVHVDNLIDADDSGLGDENLKEALPATEQ
ncbi:hypothetical protein GDO78_006343 [Eleutherodactylus coqui]|uniref:Cadherin domain-containing protein n=1 Tax=Eleutherodactylus coqui TaxID=57060 RepID=A0A8J6FN89_ELECQ|nr:hypothetical protein GDO78_006343 [Eleutherodactylus coqui]